MSYCPGSNCSRKDQCQKHHNQGQIIDWSTYGYGSSTVDNNGNCSCHTETCCGDNGMYGHVYFEQYNPIETKSNF